MKKSKELKAPGSNAAAYSPTVIIRNNVDEVIPEPEVEYIEPCIICGSTKYLHPISFDSTGEPYVDDIAGDPMCNVCLPKEEARRKKEYELSRGKI